MHATPEQLARVMLERVWRDLEVQGGLRGALQRLAAPEPRGRQLARGEAGG